MDIIGDGSISAREDEPNQAYRSGKLLCVTKRKVEAIQAYNFPAFMLDEMYRRPYFGGRSVLSSQPQLTSFLLRFINYSGKNLLLEIIKKHRFIFVRIFCMQ